MQLLHDIMLRRQDNSHLLIVAPVATVACVVYRQDILLYSHLQDSIASVPIE